MRALAAVCHHQFLTVAGSAGRGNIRMMHTGLRITSRQQLVRASMAIDASGGVTVASLHRLGVETALVRGLLVGVAGGASDLLWRSLMRRTFDIGVAVDAGEQAAVNGIFEMLWIDMQANGLAVYFVAECRVTVAGKALICGRLRRGFGPGNCFES